MSDYETAVAKAAEVGREHGENAAVAWWADYSPAAGKVIVSRMALRDGIGETFGGHLPVPDLSADEYAGCLDIPEGSSWGEVADIQGTYEEAFSEAVETAVRAACENTLSK